MRGDYEDDDNDNDNYDDNDDDEDNDDDSDVALPAQGAYSIPLSVGFYIKKKT